MPSIKKIFSKLTFSWILVGIIGIGLIATSCDHPVQPSQQPGALKITMQHNPADSLIEIADAVYELSRQDQFILTISEGRVTRARDSAYATLYSSLEEYQQEDNFYSILSLNQDGSPETYQIFETRIPPGEYTKISFVLTTTGISLDQGDRGTQSISSPVVLPPGESPLVEVDADFSIKEQKTTVVNLRISSLESLTRFRDSFRFIPEISVHRIQQP